jgi:threonine dehydrogenase-like Zn-dependent dehydrogenase
MPKELVLCGPGKPVLQEMALPPLAGDHVRVETQRTGVRFGDDSQNPGAARGYPVRPKTWGCGDIVEVGADVGIWHVGERVFAPMVHAEMQTLSQQDVFPLRWLKEDFSVFIEPGIAALHCVRQAGIRFGDRVALVGMGTVGLMAVQYARASGASSVLAVDASPERLKIALRVGATDVLDYHAVDQQRGASRRRWDAVLVLGGGEAQAIARLLPPEEERFFFMQNSQSENALASTVFYSIASKKVMVWPILSERYAFQSIVDLYARHADGKTIRLESVITY